MYKALYRKWRPLSFDDVISQPHITTTLKNQLRNNRTAHAYLFTGSRGTGKTTCARIFAKAINCQNSVNGNPCLECDICKDADNFALSDIIEIDAASNNGVDDIRDLRDGAVYTPERCQFKIYIIDEVHMLSPNAFNALLKIMEEPPEYVKFILATTEVHKIPSTILSRCQRFDFQRIKTSDIAERLIYIAEKEEISLENGAAQLIASIADGGMRDALSLLDQCASFSDKITADTVSSAAGIAGREYLFDILDAVFAKDTAKAVSVIDTLYSMSKDMSRLSDELLAQFRNIMMLKISTDNALLLRCMPNEIERLSTMAKNVQLDDILDKLSIVQECGEHLARAINKRVELEMCFVKLCSVKHDITPKNIVNSDNTDASYEKIMRLENKIAELSEMLTNQKQIKVQVPVAVEKVRPKEQAVDMSKLRAEDFKPVQSWDDILQIFAKSNPAVNGALIGSQAFINQNVLLVTAKNRFFLELFKNKENAHALGEAVKEVLGKQYIIKAKCAAPEQDTTKTKAEELIKKANANNVETSVE